MNRNVVAAALTLLLLLGLEGSGVGNGVASAQGCSGSTWVRDTIQAERDRVREVEREADHVQGNREPPPREPTPRESPRG